MPCAAVLAPYSLTCAAGMVPMPSSLRVRGLGRADGVLGFDAVDDRGEPVLSDGVVRA